MPDDVTAKRLVVRRETLLFVILFVLGATAYLWRLTWSDIWIDESFSKALARHSVPDLLRLVAHDSHPPLYFVALKGFTALVGNTDLTIRLFSVLGALAMLILAYTLGRRVLGQAGALTWTALLVALPMPGLYAHVARMYTWAAFFVMGVFLCAVLYAREGRRYQLLWLGLFSVMAAYTHYYSLLAAFWIDLSLLLYLAAKRNRGWRAVAAMGGAVVLVYLPWLFVLRSQAATVHRDFWIPPVTWDSVVAACAQPFGGFYWMYGVSWVLFAITGGLTLASLVVAWRTRQREDHLPLIFALAGFFATFATAVVLSLAFRPVLYPRYIMTLAPLLLVPAALALMRWRLQAPRAGVLMGLLAGGLFVVFSEASFSFGPYQQALRTLARTHPEVEKILHLNEVTAGPFSEYGRGGRWKQCYLNGDGTSWYSYMEILEGMDPVQQLRELVRPGEVFCIAEFAGLPLNRHNLERVTAECDTLAVEEIADEKPYPGIALRLHILRARS